jgi:hypothetical protein
MHRHQNNFPLFLSFILLCAFLSLIVGCGGGGSSEPLSGNFVATDSMGDVLTSADGINWTTRSTGGASFYGLVHGNKTFVGWQITRSLGGNIFTSPDGLNWTLRSSMTFPFIKAMIYANGLFVAVCPIGGLVLTSPDGVNWTQSAALTSPGLGSDPLEAIAYGNGIFVTTGQFGGIYYSPDAVNWTNVSDKYPFFPDAVTYGNGIFVAGGGNKIFISSDGANWTAQTLDLFPFLDILSLAYGNDMFVAVGLSTEVQGTQPISTLMIFTSPDGVNWSGGPSTIDVNARVIFVNSLFFLTGINGSIMASPDGTKWTSTNITGTIETVTFD